MAKQKSRFPSYGLVRGPSHAQGGVAGVVAGKQPVELEGGEWVVPKEVVPDYLPQLVQMTNEGRAMQGMDNGNSAIDALIASASMQNGIVSPKSPHYQAGGVVDILKQAMEQYGQPAEEGMYTPQGGRTKLGYAQEYGLAPESVGIDTLSFRNPANYMFRISGEKPSGETFTGTERATGALPLKMDVGDVIGKHYKDDPFGELDATIALKKRLEDVGRPAKEDIEKQRMMKALGMGEAEYDAFMAWKKKKMNKQQGGPVYGYQEGGKISFEQITDLAKRYREGIGFPVEEGMYTPEGGRTKAGYARQFGVEPEAFDIDTVAFRSPSNYALRFVGAEGTPVTSAYTEGMDRTSMLPILADIIGERAKKGKRPAAGDFDAMSKYVNERMKQGEMEKVFGQLARQATLEYPKEKQRFQQGGQVLPRKQQEMRSPEVYGPPVSMMTVPDTSAQDTSGAALDSMLMQLMMRDVNQSVNPFTGDTLDFAKDSLQLLDSMRKSKIPRDSSRVIMQQGGMVESPQLMQDMSQDRRIKPLQPDRYVIKDDTPGGEGQREMSVPKLHSAYLGALGMETPLSKRQGALLSERGIPPQSMAPHLESLVGRVLIQRLGNEPQ